MSYQGQHPQADFSTGAQGHLSPCLVVHGLDSRSGAVRAELDDFLVTFPQQPGTLPTRVVAAGLPPAATDVLPSLTVAAVVVVVAGAGGRSP